MSVSVDNDESKTESDGPAKTDDSVALEKWKKEQHKYLFIALYIIYTIISLIRPSYFQWKVVL